MNESLDIPDDTSQLQHAIFISVTVVISLIVLSAVMINILIIISVKKFKRLQIPANFILINLSVADCGVAVASCVHLSTGLLLPENGDACVASLSFVFLTCNASLLSLALIAYDRFSALVKPLTYSSRLTNMRIVLYVTVIWTYTSVVTVTSLSVLLSGIDNSAPLEENATVVWDNVTEPPNTSYHHDTDLFCFREQSTNAVLLCQVSFIFLPGASVMFYCYGRVTLVARHHSRAISAVQGNLRQSKFNKTYGMFRGKKYFVTLTSILGVFTATWALFVFLALLDAFCASCFRKGFLSHSYFCTLPLVNTGINPWIYTCRSQDFRASFLRLYKSARSCCCKGERPPVGRQRRDSRFSDGLSRTNSMIGNNQQLQALYNEAYYNQKNDQNCSNGAKSRSVTLQSVSGSAAANLVQPKADPIKSVHED